LADLVNSYLDKIDEIQAIIINDADLILDAIEMDLLLKDPEGYLMSLGEAFLDEHMDEIEQGAKAGQQLAKKMVKSVERRKNHS